MASDNAVIPLIVSWSSDELPIPSVRMLWMHDEMEIQPSSPISKYLISSVFICKMQQNWLTAFNLNAYIVMSFMSCLWCNSELVKSLWAHSITCCWSHTSYMKTNNCWIAVNTLLKLSKRYSICCQFWKSEYGRRSNRCLNLYKHHQHSGVATMPFRVLRPCLLITSQLPVANLLFCDKLRIFLVSFVMSNEINFCSVLF